MKKLKPIKPFKTLDEEAEFWDTHDTSEIFKNPKVSMSDLLELEPRKDVVMTVRVQKILIILNSLFEIKQTSIS